MVKLKLNLSEILIDYTVKFSSIRRLTYLSVILFCDLYFDRNEKILNLDQYLVGTWKSNFKSTQIYSDFRMKREIPKSSLDLWIVNETIFHFFEMTDHQHNCDQ